MAGTPKKNMLLEKLDEILDRIESGDSHGEIAKDLGVSRGFLLGVLRSNEEIQARARAAQVQSAQSWMDRGLEELLNLASNGTAADITRAKELAQHCRKMAAIRNPEYGEKIGLSGTINHEHSVSALLEAIAPPPLLPGLTRPIIDISPLPDSE